MSDTVNPYQSPENVAVPVIPLAVQGKLTETMLSYLKEASPWLRFVGIIGFVSAGFTFLSGIFLFILFSVLGQFWRGIPGFNTSAGDYIGEFFGGSMAVIFIAAGVLVFFPALFLYRFGEKIRGYLRTGADQDLELAFKNNRSFWKFTGILCIIQLAFIPVIIIGTLVVGAAMALF